MRGPISGARITNSDAGKATPVSIERISTEDLAAGPARLAALVALNNGNASELSLIDADGLCALVAMAFCAATASTDKALLLAFGPAADYDNANFRWCQSRYDDFIYVDRIVTSPAARGQGLARALYSDLFAMARSAGHSRILCEINCEPPNLASDAFHEALGFAPVGEAQLTDAKRVRYWELAL